MVGSMRRAPRFITGAVIAATFSAGTAAAQSCVPQITMLLGTGETGAGQLGRTVDVSADGNTAIVGAPTDNSSVGAVFVFVRSGGVWTQQGAKLTPTGATGASQFGSAVALSDDGNTAFIGAPEDNAQKGAVYAFVRSGGVWNQQGGKLVPTGSTGTLGIFLTGVSVAISGDGNTAITGSILDGDGIGAAFVFVRSAGVWTQQAKRLPTGAIGTSVFGGSVALSADGNTAMIGALDDNSGVGAAHVHVRSGTVWSHQQKLTPTGGTGAGRFGSAALSADGNTAVIGASGDNTNVGAAYAFTRSGTVWSQQGSKILPSGNTGAGLFGAYVSLSADGNRALIGAPNDATNVGAGYILTRNAGVWSQAGSKFAPTGGTGAGKMGSSSAISGDGETLVLGAPNNNTNVGTAYVFAFNPAIQITFHPTTAQVSVLNGMAMFSVAANSAAPLTYQWRRNGVNLSNGVSGTGAVIAGATTPSMTVSMVTKLDNAGAFDCVVSSACGSAQSNPAGLGFGPVCAADFNVSGTKTVQDLFDFLAAWFPACP